MVEIWDGDRDSFRFGVGEPEIIFTQSLPLKRIAGGLDRLFFVGLHQLLPPLSLAGGKHPPKHAYAKEN